MNDGKSLTTTAAFTITTPSTTAKLDANRKAQVAFTVTNASIQPMRGRARVVPMDGAKPEWLTIDGDAERAFASSGTQQYTVQVTVPPTAPAGKYKFQLKVVGVANPDEQYGESEQVAFEVPQPVKPSTPLPMWIWIVAAVVALLILAGIGLGVYLANRKPTASFNTASVDFGNQLVGTSSPGKNVVTVKSTGPVDLHVKSVSIAGANASEFVKTDSCSGKTVTSGSSCSVSIVFTPAATGPRTGSLVFTMDTESGSKSIALKGQGVQPVVSLNPTQLSLIAHYAGGQQGSQTVMLTNTGTGDLTVTGVRADNRAFTILQQGCTPHPIAPGSVCSITVGYFYPTIGYSINGILVITDNAKPGSQTVPLHGTTVYP
jgi:hypothetical protein